MSNYYQDQSWAFFPAGSYTQRPEEIVSMPTTVTIPQPIPLDHNTAFDFFRVPKVPQDLGLHFDYGFDTSNSTPDSRFPSAIATFKSVHIEFANLAPQQSPGPNVKILGDLQFGAAIKKQKLLDGSSRSIQDHSLSCEADHTFLSTASKLDSPALSKNSPTESNQKKGSGADYTPLSASMRALPALSSNSLAESSRPKGSEVDHNSASKRALPALASKNPAISNQQKTNVGRAAYQKKSRFLKQLKCKTRLRKDRPVVAEVNLDIWREILAFCPPDFLIKARGVCKTFKSILDEKSQMVWQLSRIRYFGPAIPDPPLGVSEMQYADLITGTGCQNINCKMEKAARKTYWAFQRRLCDDCLHARAVKYHEVKTTVGDEYYERISECIPQIKFDAWGKYQWVGDYDPLPIWAKIHQSNQRTYYGKDTVNEIIDELCKLQTSGSTDAQIDEWFEVRRLSNAAKVRRLQLIENWCETSRIEHLCASAAFKRKRAAFYDDHAGRMGLDLATLANCPSYKRFTAIAKPVTLRSWTILLKNLQKDDWKEWKDVVQANDEARRHLESMHTNFTAYRGNWWDIVGNGPCGP